eukprot:gene41390-39742_t
MGPDCGRRAKCVRVMRARVCGVSKGALYVEGVGLGHPVMVDGPSGMAVELVG